ncbi:hypothetical protein CAL26_23490 [Bordetella genomosp. 9]|uniref:DUF2244 domain-containing protein n=1 Tax=Bordetella genomosp. 9 TaxID=1416803 RepID=A0A261R610_9BORD|nr:DUF2244 domain-containing protein [Bordetella genomosp. 9]OZI20464.1 hypothetical protein CAL26_23490 [Bordetella genomosp. 9]
MRLLRDDIQELLSAAPPADAARRVSAGRPRGPRSWRLKRNCALRPAQYLAAIGVLMGMSALVAVGCWIRGLWLVPVFCGAELLGITVAALAYAHHAIDGEIVRVDKDGQVHVDVDRGRRHDRYVFPSSQTRLVKPADAPGTLWLHHGATRIELARYVSTDTREAFEGQLRQALRETWS